MALFITLHSIGGGILTNSNQSANYVRLLSRNASLGIDGAYYNPAGLVKLENGLFLSFHNQTIFQTKTINNSFPLLNNSSYEGTTTVPVFPTFFAVYKKDKFAISFAAGPNAGGGSAKYKKGLPSFEYQISELPALLSSMGIPTSLYSVDIDFDGSSIFWGPQVDFSYAFTDNISASIGMRYIYAVNTYNGNIKNIMFNPTHPQINPNGNMMSAVDFFTAAGMNDYVQMVSDKEVDVKQTGTGFTPIIGFNFNYEKLNIGCKYEFETKLDLENDTKKDGTGMFPDGQKFRNDIPATLSLGIEYSILDNLRASFSWNHYFDKNVDWEGKENFINDNLYELSLGLEYDINDAICFSIGFLHSQTGVGQGYQTDISYSLSSNSVGFGAMFKASDKINLNVGCLYAMYEDGEKIIDYGNFGSYKETYDKTTLIFALGIDYKLF